MRHIRIAPPEDDDFTVFVIRLQRVKLVAENAAAAPENAHEFHPDGVEEILGAHGLQEGLGRGGRRAGGASAASDEGRGARSVGLQDCVGLFRDFSIGLIPGDSFIVIPHSLFGVQDPLAVFHKILCRSALAAAVAFAAGAVGVGPNVDDPVVLYLHLQPAGHGT